MTVIQKALFPNLATFMLTDITQFDLILKNLIEQFTEKGGSCKMESFTVFSRCMTLLTA